MSQLSWWTWDEVDAVGHWEGNTRRETYAAKIPKSAVCALAGFYVGEQYNVPWATTHAPTELQMQIFPFVEDALANLRQTPNPNYGTINFLELLQLLRPYFWRAIAAIHQSFPDSALLKRLKILQGSSSTKAFLQQWPKERQALEATAQSDLAISGLFSEAATQSAFVSLTNSQRQLESTINAVLSHCNQLLRRTEPLSPSKYHRGAPSRFSFMAVPNTSCNLSQCTSFSTDLPHQTASHEGPCTPRATSATVDSRNFPPELVDEYATSGTHTGLAQQTVTEVCRASEDTPARHLQPSMSPTTIVHDGCSFHVLPLSPAMSLDFHSGRDLTIPSAEAFCDPITASAPQFAQFMARNCSWSSIFEMVKQPHLLWACWHPLNLGEYHSVKQLWVAWHEGTIIGGVGQTPPLQLIEQEWGGTKNHSTHSDLAATQ
ncbi:hypothetical protein EV702DRAFT_1202776 [Suillus placidus]|uniref:Ndc10 domain-containing protein n=1 Tax=Suillus placidus TaxID=48579 RepID=A0A9P7CY65_9AGAM|nr:hypothetical protein EV702DRAFT_1202776 [Suillus placidus]